MNNFVIHSKEDIEKIRKASAMTAFLRNEVCSKLRPGMSTFEVDNIAKKIIHDMGASSAFYGYKGFPGQICISINSEVVHGYGKENVFIGIDDLITIDCGVRKDGALGDSAVTVSLSPVSGRIAELLDVTEKSLYEGISAAKVGNTVRDIGEAVYRVVKGAGFDVLRNYCGHGVGINLHEPPCVPNYPSVVNQELFEGMVIAIEPMVVVGDYKTLVDSDGWTVKTEDGFLSAHFEHTILVTNGEPEILTK